MGILFIIAVLLMVAAAAAIFWHGRGMLFVDPQPRYYVLDEDEIDRRDRWPVVDRYSF